MWTKICANTNAEDALLAVENGADAVGFVFAPSRRQVTAEQVREILKALPASVEKVGVFATDNAKEIGDSVALAGLTAAQLHGAFRAALVQEIADARPDIKIIQTVAYELEPADREEHDARFEATLRSAFAEPKVWAVLLDAAKSGSSGGLGVSFDWEHVGRIVERVRSASGNKAPHVILAGGLKPENVAEAIAKLGPWGVDVASGVEASAGKKDPLKLQEFLAAAKSSR